jgi:hypothetical protein
MALVFSCLEDLITTNRKLFAIHVPQSFHVYLILLGQERLLLKRRRIISSACREIEFEKQVVEDRDLVMICTVALDNCFVQIPEIAIGLWRIIFRSYIRSSLSFESLQ